MASKKRSSRSIRPGRGPAPKKARLPESVYEQWVRKQKVKPKIRRSTATLPPDSYQEWLKLQTVKPPREKSEVEVPLGAYESWIRLQVKNWKPKAKHPEEANRN